MTVSVTELELSVIDVAFTVTVVLVGSDAGAVYVTAAPFAVVSGATAPHALGHGAPACSSCQVTPLAVGS
jgi:hypothetical protein